MEAPSGAVEEAKGSVRKGPEMGEGSGTGSGGQTGTTRPAGRNTTGCGGVDEYVTGCGGQPVRMTTRAEVTAPDALYVTKGDSQARPERSEGIDPPGAVKHMIPPGAVDLRSMLPGAVKGHGGWQQGQQ